MTRIDLAAVERTLRRYRTASSALPTCIDDVREPLGEGALRHLLAAYACLDRSVADGTDLLVPGHSARLLGLNHLVLYGHEGAAKPPERRAFEASEKRFYRGRGGGVESLFEWRATHRHLDPAQRAAGLFLQTVAMPQLFVEGNHRTAALIASHELLHAGWPPFVMSVGDAREVLAVASIVRAWPRQGLRMFLDGRRARRRLAAAMLGASDDDHLIAAAPAMTPRPAHEPRPASLGST